MSNEWTEEGIVELLMNPDQISLVGRELWVKANLQLIEDRGAEWWLNHFAAGWDESLDDAGEPA